MKKKNYESVCVTVGSWHGSLSRGQPPWVKPDRGEWGVCRSQREHTQCLLALPPWHTETIVQAIDFPAAVGKLQIMHESENISLCFRGLRDFRNTLHTYFMAFCIGSETSLELELVVKKTLSKNSLSVT